MGDLLIRNVPEDLKRELSEAAHRAGRSLSDEAKMRLQGSSIGNVEPTKSGKAFLEEIQALFADIPDDERDEFAKIMDEIEQERKKDFGRPFSFDE